MPRSKDLDTVAPDDPIQNPSDTSKNNPPESQPEPENVAPPPTDTSNQPLKDKINQILGHTKHPFSSFLANPKVFSFKEQDDDETIYLVLRRHWITNLTWILITIIMVLGPSLLTFVPLLDSFPPSYRFISIIFWYLITFAYAFEQFLSWYFNVYIITNERVVDIDFNNLLNKKFSEADLSVIQDVTSSIVGVSETIFNYGDILVQTAAEINEIVFEKVPNPEKVIKVLGELREANQDSHH